MGSINNYLIILFIFLLLSCTEREASLDPIESNELYILNFEKEFRSIDPSIDTITINSIAKNIEFITLETTDDCLLSDFNFTMAEVNGDYFVSSGMFHATSGVLQFNKQGKLKHKFYEKGNGPLELPYLTSWSVNDSLNMVSIFGASIRVVTYNLNDNKKQSLLLEQHGFRPILLDDSTYVAFSSSFPSENNDIPYLVYFDNNGEIIHSLYYKKGHNVGYEIRENMLSEIIYECYGIYRGIKGSVLLKDVFNDTIYRTKSRYDIIPYICTYRGKMTPLHAYVTDAKRQTSALFIRQVAETENYFITSYRYNKTKQTAIWDKANRKIIARHINSDDASREYNYNHTVQYRTPTGSTVLLNVVYCTQKAIYCMLRVEDAVSFIPDIILEGNPLIVKFYL